MTAEPAPQHLHAPFALAGIGLAALAMAIALIHTFVGPFAPTQSIEVSIGEIAAGIRDSAQRALLGQEQPAPVARAWDIDRILRAVAPTMGVFAIVVALVGMIRKEPAKLVLCGVAFGAMAVMIQVLLYAVLLIAGVVLLIGIMQNLDSILG
ncbi:hypothetical protein [uncultured Roseobacter sp.]|uniref:hypothetical protein n=1 Tax=uncultured Roseobacter sp. TaxID=114847 RepID=UPI0026052C1A|nr:hypothetical protein [uncultured Roseobacter sp.]